MAFQHCGFSTSCISAPINSLLLDPAPSVSARSVSAPNVNVKAKRNIESKKHDRKKERKIGAETPSVANKRVKIEQCGNISCTKRHSVETWHSCSDIMDSSFNKGHNVWIVMLHKTTEIGNVWSVVMHKTINIGNVECNVKQDH